MTRSGVLSQSITLRSVNTKGTGDHESPQNKLTLFTSTVALFCPISDIENGCRTQWVDDTVSGSMTVTARPHGCPQTNMA
jgi:hypothetical protein